MHVTELPHLLIAIYFFFQFIIGDTRVHEIPNLALNHLVWVREHNRIAAILNRINPHWNVEKVFQETRRIIIALVQHIAYNHYLPVVLDNQSMNRYRLYSRKTGYDDIYNKRIDASICNGFAAAPFRFGHSQIMPHQTLLHEDYLTSSCNNVAPVTNLCLGRATTRSHSSQWSNKTIAVET
jgi:hypothetical protein